MGAHRNRSDGEQPAGGRRRALSRPRLGIIGMVTCLLGLLLTAAPMRADADPAVTISWPMQQRTLADGRTYWVRAPSCTPVDAPDCVSFLSQPRAVVMWFHHAWGPEDADAARTALAILASWNRDVIFVFAVSDQGTRVWDAVTCCANTNVDELGYIERVVDDVAAQWTVNRARVGAVGLSNGGMLAERAACQRPGLVVAASSLAGSFGGSCDVGLSQVAQWHGASDQMVPLNGGRVWINGGLRTIPPAAGLAQRMARGSTFELRVRPNYGHSLPWPDVKEAVLWVVAHLPS